MINAQVELIDHVKDRVKDIELIRIVLNPYYDEYNRTVIEGTLEEVFPKLDFTYDNGFGSQELFGYIWYSDGTWSQRGEYDGSEWWEHMVRPPKDIKIIP